VLLPAALLAHDTWLVPTTFRTEMGKAVQVRLATSEAFPTSDSAVGPERVAQFFVRDAAGIQPVTGFRVEKEFLVAEVTPARPGHTIATAETKPRAFVLEPKVFNDYLRGEELKAIMDARAQAGERDSPGRERYRKIAKAVVCVGEARDTTFKQVEGLWLEIVPMKSPCQLRAGDDLEVQVLHKGKPLAGVRVGAGYAGVTGHGYPIWTRTDEKGRAAVIFDRPGAWFVRTLHMVRAKDDPEADWHSAFSTLTFEVLPKR
jgi:hypothetical protein